MSDESPGETMTLPIEGAAALRQILGILSDHEIEDSDGRLDALDRCGSSYDTTKFRSFEDPS